MVTPNKYRFILGKSVDTSVNLVTNGTFTGSLTGWTTIGATRWTAVANTAQASANEADPFERNIIKQVGIVTPGVEYYLSYKMKKISSVAPAKVTPSVGGVYYDVVNDYDENNTTTFVTFTHERMFCSHGNDLLFYKANSDCAIDDVVLYPYVWNSPLTYEPVDWDSAKITKKRDEVLNGLIIQYIANVTFIEDGYDYIYNQFITNGYCEDIPVRIEVYNSVTSVYEEFYEGQIFVNNCQFNISKRQVTVDINDGTDSKIFINGRNKKSSIFAEYYDSTNNGLSFNDFPISAPMPDTLVNINDDTGSYTNYCQYWYSAEIYNLLRRLIIKSTNYRLDFDSTFFSSGTFDKFCISVGELATSDFSLDPGTYQMSVNELFTELNKLFNLSFSIDNSGAIPKVIIEPKIDYLSSTPVLVLNRVADLEMTLDNENIVRSINAGYKYLDSTPTGEGQNTPKGIQYNTDNICSEKELNLVSEFIQNSAIIKNLMSMGAPPVITSNKYDKVYVWLQTTATLDAGCGPPSMYLTKNSGSGTFDINPDIETADNVARLIETLQTTFLEPTREGENAVIKSNSALTTIYSFSYPITKAQFDLIVQAYNTIDFNTDGTGLTTKSGYLLSADYNIKTGLTEFKLLAG